MIKERIASLLTVKSLVTLILTGVFGYLSASKLISPEQFLTVFTMVISFYFGVQYEKKNTNTNEEVINTVEEPIEEFSLIKKNDEEA